MLVLGKNAMYLPRPRRHEARHLLDVFPNLTDTEPAVRYIGFTPEIVYPCIFEFSLNYVDTVNIQLVSPLLIYGMRGHRRCISALNLLRLSVQWFEHFCQVSISMSMFVLHATATSLSPYINVAFRQTRTWSNIGLSHRRESQFQLLIVMGT